MSEAISLLYRLSRDRSRLILGVAVGPHLPDPILFRDDATLTSNDDCIRALIKQDFPDTPDIRHAYGRTLRHLVGLGRYDLFDVAKRALSDSPMGLMFLLNMIMI